MVVRQGYYLHVYNYAPAVVNLIILPYLLVSKHGVKRDQYNQSLFSSFMVTTALLNIEGGENWMRYLYIYGIFSEERTTVCLKEHQN